MIRSTFRGAMALLILCSLTAQGWAAGLHLEGAALRDTFVKVRSDDPGKWTVFKVNGSLDVVDLIILEDGKLCVFVGGPGKYAVMCSVADEPAVRVLKVEIQGEEGPIRPVQTPPQDDPENPTPPEPEGGDPNPRPPEQEEPEAPQWSPLALEIIAQTNAYRARHGLGALSIDPVLMRSAQAWTEVMARSGRFNHSPSGPYRPGASENIAYGNSDPSRTMGQWIGSSGHRRNMLGSHAVMGVGVADGSRGRYWTQQFRGSPASGATQPPPRNSETISGPRNYNRNRTFLRPFRRR